MDAIERLIFTAAAAVIVDAAIASNLGKFWMFFVLCIQLIFIGLLLEGTNCC